MNIIKSRSFQVLVIFLLIGISVSFLVFWFHPTGRYARQVKTGIKQLDEEIKKEEALYAGDTYGGKTPEETYRMFLEALQKQDIDLASKYFILDKQVEYKTLLEEIKKNGRWETMMEDLLKPENQKGKFLGENLYVIEIMHNKQLVTQIGFSVPKSMIDPSNKSLGTVWKIIDF